MIQTYSQKIEHQILIRQIKKLFEEKTGWGNSGQWGSQDFLQLSEMIWQQTGETISPVTLKRIWGKVRYDSLPSTHTLNILVQFLGYEKWRDFSVRHAETGLSAPPREKRMRKVIWMAVALAVILLVLRFLHSQQPSPQTQDEAFRSKKVMTADQQSPDTTTRSPESITASLGGVRSTMYR